jgi:hypothetical protein
MKVIPRSIAEWIVDIARSRSPVWPPQAQLPIAWVLSPMREAAIPDVPISIVSMARSFISSDRPRSGPAFPVALPALL